MDPEAFDELDKLGEEAILRVKACEEHEREWQEFVKRRDERRRRREGEAANLPEVEDTVEQVGAAAAAEEGEEKPRRCEAARSRPVGRRSEEEEREKVRAELARIRRARQAREQPPSSGGGAVAGAAGVAGEGRGEQARLSDRRRPQAPCPQAPAQTAVRASPTAPAAVASDVAEPRFGKDDPLADFCRRQMMSSRARREEPVARTEEAVDAAPSLQGLLESIDRDEEEDREYEAIRHLLPDLDNAGRRVTDAITAYDAEPENVVLKAAVRHMQEQNPDVDFTYVMSSHSRDVVRAGALIDADANHGRLEAIGEVMRRRLDEEHSLMDERREIRQQQRAAAASAREAEARAAAARPPRNRKIVAGSASSSSGVPSSAAAGGQWFAPAAGAALAPTFPAEDSATKWRGAWAPEARPTVSRGFRANQDVD